MLGFADLNIGTNETIRNVMNNELVSLCDAAFDEVAFFAKMTPIHGVNFSSREEMLYALEKLEISEDQRDRFPLSYYFPLWYPVKKMIPTLIALYSLLKSEELYVPTLIMKYLLAYLINAAINDLFEDGNGLEAVKDMISKEDRACEDFGGFDAEIEEALMEKVSYAICDDTLLKKLFDASVKIEKEYAEEFSSYDKGEVNRRARLRSLSYQYPCKEWLEEYCFWDYDYDMLNYCKEDDLRNSYVNDVAQILPKDPKEERYVVPEDWVTSTKFRFVSDDN